LPLLLLPFVVPEALMKENGCSVALDRGLAIVSGVVRAFLAKCLDVQGRALDGVTSAYPEVSLDFHP
jgi:hypothetical protein